MGPGMGLIFIYTDEQVSCPYKKTPVPLEEKKTIENPILFTPVILAKARIEKIFNHDGTEKH